MYLSRIYLLLLFDVKSSIITALTLKCLFKLIYSDIRSSSMKSYSPSKYIQSCCLFINVFSIKILGRFFKGIS